jgi:hypothetical protein
VKISKFEGERGARVTIRQLAEVVDRLERPRHPGLHCVRDNSRPIAPITTSSAITPNPLANSIRSTATPCTLPASGTSASASVKTKHPTT